MSGARGQRTWLKYRKLFVLSFALAVTVFSVSWRLSSVVAYISGSASYQSLKYATVLESRALFPHLLRHSLGLIEHGLEVGVAEGLNSKNIVHSWRPKSWTMVDVATSDNLEKTLQAMRDQSYETSVTFIQGSSLDYKVLERLPEGHYDFIYLDGAHDHDNVKAELEIYYRRVKPGGVFAGHDYCTNQTIEANLLERQLTPPSCGVYTGVQTGGGRVKPAGTPTADMGGVVRAVLEWVKELHPDLQVRSTAENFTKMSLARHGLDYDSILTKTRNPSWWFIKPV